MKRASGGEARTEAASSLWKSRFWKKLKRNRLGLVAGIVFIIIVLICIFGPMVSPYEHDVIDLANGFSPPSREHILGTDKLGRDVATRLMMGGRVSLSVGVVGLAISISIGIILGSISGYVGGKTDAILLKISEIVLCFPVFILILTLVSIMGPNIANIMTVLGLVWWTGTYRVIRNQFISIREMEFVEAARALGVRHIPMIFREILPSAITPVLVQITLRLASNIIVEAGLSFLGLGVQPPTPSWGNLLNSAQNIDILRNKPWLWLSPGLMISITVLSINFLGDALRDALDPLTSSDR